MKNKWIILIGVLFCVSHVFADDFIENDISDHKRIFQDQAVRAVGISAPGQSEYAAITAAQVVAQRNLLGIIKGLTIYSEETLESNRLQSDVIYTRIQGILRGATPCSEPYYDPDKGQAKVCMQVSMHGYMGVYPVVYPFIENILPKSKKFAADVTPPVIKAVLYDGLIVDVRNFGFQPALANRILNVDDSVVYEPSVVPHKLLRDWGPAQFSATEEKARAILQSMGSKTLLIVKAKQVRSGTDAVIEEKDAQTVFASNKKSNMLANARVVFLME